MTKTIKVKIDKNPVPTVEENVVVSAEEKTVVPDKTPAEVKATRNEWPEVGSTGKFSAVPFKDGYVVYNPSGQRATGVVTKVAADDIVREQNRAAQIKG